MKIDLKKEITVSKSKSKYPTKTTLNLLMQDKTMTEPKKAVVIFVLFALILGVFVKFFVVDKLAEAYAAQKAYEDMQNQIAQLRQINESSETVKKQYSHYGYGYLNKSEKLMSDRMEMLRLIDGAVLSKAEIQAVDIAENVATITIDKIRLKTVSEIVAPLESKEQVAFVTVSTAGTDRDSNSTVSATMVIYFHDGIGASESIGNGGADGNGAGVADAGTGASNISGAFDAGVGAGSAGASRAGNAGEAGEQR